MINIFQEKQAGWRGHALALALLCAIGFATFYNGLHGEFMLDDHAFFEEIMRNIKYLHYQFIPDKHIHLGVEAGKGDAYYRPLAHVLPMLCYVSFQSNTFHHHLFNLIFFIGTMWIVYLCLTAIFGDWRLGLITSVLFLVHPFNGVVVNYITANIYTLQVLLEMLCLFFVWKYTSQSRANRFYIVLAFIVFALSFLCHETSFALPFYITALVVFVCRKRNWKDVAKIVTPFFALAFCYFLWRLRYSSLHKSILSHYSMYDMNAWEYLASMSKLVVYYMGKFFVPDNVLMIYAMPVLKENIGWWIVAGACVVGIYGYLVYSYRRESWGLFGLSLFGIGWIPFAFACVFQPTHGIMIEPHWFIFPSLGLFFFITFVLIKLWDRTRARWVVGAAVALVASWVLLSQQLNFYWGNEIRYCRYWLRACPGFSAAEFYLAKAYELNKQYDLARKHYHVALKSRYQMDITLTNLGLMDLMESNYESARSYFMAALSIDPDLAIVLSNLGVIAYQEKDYTTALQYFEKAIDKDRFLVMPRLNAATIYRKQGNLQRAIAEYQAILTIVPRHEIAMRLLMNAYAQNNEKDKAIALADDLSATSWDLQMLVESGRIYHIYGLQDKERAAYNRFQKAVALHKQGKMILPDGQGGNPGMLRIKTQDNP